MFQDFFENNATLCEYEEGDVLVDCNSTPTHVFYLVSGYVKASVLSPRGNEHVLIFYKPGDIFPARWAFTDIKGYAFYTAISPVTVRKVVKNNFTEYLINHPEKLLQAVQYTTLIMDVFVNRVNDMAHLTAYLKTISLLLSLAERYGHMEGKSTLIDIPVTQSDLARTIAMTRETISRELKKLELKHIITYKNQKIFIPNRDALRNELNSSHQ